MVLRISIHKVPFSGKKYKVYTFKNNTLTKRLKSTSNKSSRNKFRFTFLIKSGKFFQKTKAKQSIGLI